MVDERLASAGEPTDRVTVRLLGMPVQVFAHYRVWYDELRRELRLLALNHGGDYPLAQELSEITLQVEQERRQASGVDRLDAAIAAGQDRVDLEYHVPVSAGATMGRLLDPARGGRRVLPRAAAADPRAATRSSSPCGSGTSASSPARRPARRPTPWSGSYAVEEAR